VSRADHTYDAEPENQHEFTESFDRSYSRFAALYDIAVEYLPVWKTWLRSALPHLRGPCVLEISFGTGYLLTQYAHRFETHGIDYNETMVRTARQNLVRAGSGAHLCRARVEALPYGDQAFDTIVNTMAFSGYPNARQALEEIRRVLRPDGRIVLIDVNYPADGNWIGTMLTHGAKRAGDLIRNLPELFHDFGFTFTDEGIGGCGSVHLYVAEKER
jgi:ubiquinone/menaquinone biosynthesis C-methylase UbiE